MGLRARLILIVTLGLSISLAASLGVLVRLEDIDERQDASNRTGALLAALSAPISVLLTQGRTADLDNLMNELDARKTRLGLSGITLVDQHGVVLAETDAHLRGGGAARAPRFGENAAARDPFIARAVAAAGALQDPEPPARPRRVSVPVQAGVRWATLIGALDEKNLSQRLVDRRARLVTSAIAVSSLGLVILLMLLNLEVLTPIRSIVRMAAGLAAGDLKARAQVRGATELQILATTLNSAARKLGQTQEDLEAEVTRRTDELQNKNAELSQLNAQLERLALSDPLTGLFNRRYLDQALALETTRQRRGKRPFSLVMLDVDHFKHYNDSHGHPKGDVLLRELSTLLTQNVRASDIVCRVGGEEFVVVLIDAELPTAFAAAEKLRAAVAAHPFAHGADQPLGKLTVSVGVASWPKHGIEPDDVLEAADRALYKSKGGGRNRVTAAASPGEPA